jgi:hypothetical protein
MRHVAYSFISQMKKPEWLCRHVVFNRDGSRGARFYAERRVKLAGSLADRFNARLIGVAAQPCSLSVSSIATACAPGLVHEQDRIRDELAQAEAIFRRGAGTRNNIEWRSASMPVDFIAEQARAADLIVVSQKAHSDDSPGDPPRTPPISSVVDPPSVTVPVLAPVGLHLLQIDFRFV